jgi:YVTN family beta-propeller protein
LEKLRIHLTGEVRIESGARHVEGSQFPGRLGRLAFAYLVAEHDRPVSREELAETLWNGEPPATWEKGTAVLASRLRTVLADVQPGSRDLLGFAYGCYQLHLPAGTWIDVADAEQSAAAAETALAAGDHPAALGHATTALTTARREFLPGEDGQWVQRRREGLRRVVVRALDCQAEANLELGNARAAVAAAKEAVALEPYRESGYVALMRGFAAAGDRAEALRVHEQCRRLLAEELGVDPSPQTEAVHLEILRSKPAPVEDARIEARAVIPTEAGAVSPVAIPTMRRQPFRRPPRPAIAARVLLGTVTAVIAAVVLAGHLGSSTPPPIVPGIDTVARLDQRSHAFTLAAAVGQRPTGIAVTDQYVWAINDGSQTLSWIDRATGTVRSRSVGGPPTAIAAGAGAIWVTAQFGLSNLAGGSVLRFDAGTGQPAAPIPLGDGVEGIAYGDGGVWVTNALDDTVVRIDSLTNAVSAPITVGRQPVAVAVGGNSVWVADQLDSTVTRIDARTRAVTAIITVATPSAIAADADSVWVVSTLAGSATRLDPTTNGVVTTIRDLASPTAVSVDAGSAWLTLGGDGRIVRIDGASNRPAVVATTPGRPDGIVARSGDVWVAIHG